MNEMRAKKSNRIVRPGDPHNNDRAPMGGGHFSIPQNPKKLVHMSESAPRSGRAASIIAFFIIAAFAAPARAALDPDRIDSAIAKAKAFIYQNQLIDGRWEKDPFRIGEDDNWGKMQGSTYGGYTALCTYALLAAGESPNDKRIKAAVNFLKHVELIGVYAIAMRLQVWLLVPHESSEMKALIHKDADFLLNNVNIKADVIGSNDGLWDYLGKGPRVDHSVSQYGVLGLWAAEQTGVVDVSASKWKLFESAWRRDQQSEGGWSYEAKGDQTVSMTAAGVASLFITADYLHADEGVNCLGTLTNPWIDRGLHWIDANYDQINGSTYAMYGIERIGTASGYKFFGSHDWFVDLTQELLSSQKADGSWSSAYPGSQPLDATCFALLFLARGQAPVLMNKLDYHLHAPVPGKPAAPPPTSGPTLMETVNWNERPRDLANLAAFVGHQTETYRNWQIVTLQALPEDLHDAPVLYLSGSDALEITPEDARRLKLFVQQGGMILGNADCGKEAFVRSFKSLGRSLFGGTFRELSPQHPAFTHEQFAAKRWRVHPSVLGLTNGVREFMILLPDSDPARWWQTPNGAAGHEDAFELGADLYQYAIDRQLWNKGRSYIVRTNPSAPPVEHKLKLARLAVGINWDPEPGGWVRLAAILHNADQTDMAVLPVAPGSGNLAAMHVAHLTGTTAFTLTNPARLEIKSFVEHGGTLVIDAAGGSLPFADSAEQELKNIFGPAATPQLEQPLPPSHPVYRLRHHEIDSFTYRAWARENSVGALKDPQVKGIVIGNRVGVFFSREDLSAGLVGEPVDGIIGYTPETATAIMRNILLYADQSAK